MPEGLPPFFYASFPVPNALVDALLPDLKDTEIRLLLVLLRQTWGRRDPKTGRPKARDWLTHGRLKRATGRASEAVSAAVDGLVRRGLMIVEDESGRALTTPAERRRLAAALYFRLGPKLAGAGASEAATPDRETEIRKAKTTKYKQDNIDFAFREAWGPDKAYRQASTGQPSLTPEQKAMIEATREQIRARLAGFRRPGR